MKYLIVLISIILLQGCGTEDWNSLRTKTENALNQKDYTGALEFLNSALDKDPKNPEIHYYLGQTYRLMLFTDGGSINNVDIPYASRSSEHFRLATEISPKYTGKKFILDPYSKIQTIWGSVACTYLYRSKADSAVWAFKQGKEAGGYYSSMLEFNKNIMASCEENAILLTNGDNDTYPMWYLQFVENYRKDITVINLNLLNVPWYIRQLKNSYPYGSNNLFLTISDADIDSLRPVKWQEKLVEIPVTKDPLNKEKKIEWSLKPTFENKAILVQDSLIIAILKSNNWNRPIYFSATVYDRCKIGLDEYLTLEGLVYRINSHKEKLDPEKLYSNLTKVYAYDGVNDVHIKNVEEVSALFQNYRELFFALASFYSDEGRKHKAAELLGFMSDKLPEALLPYTDNGLKDKMNRLIEQI